MMTRENEPSLFLIATPIGNLRDITLRAIEILKQVDYVACEDTRKTGILLKHFEIKKPMISFFEHNEAKSTQKIRDLLLEGKRVALVSSAGTPGISDPGFTLVRMAIKDNIPFTMIPGASGLIMALVLSGLPSHSFIFRGFSPRKSGARKNFLAIDQFSPHTLIFYESPHRLIDFLRDAYEIFGDRKACIANDLTKMFEVVLRDQISNLLIQLENSKLLGEYIVVIEGFDPSR